LPSVAAITPRDKLSGAGLPWPLHPACAVWPEMSPAELSELADDIAARGLIEPIVLTPDGLLLDGRNRGLACLMAGVELTTVVYPGDPWAYSLSRNKHRRHMTVDKIENAGVTESAVKSAKVVLDHGTAEEIAAIHTGAKKVRPTADTVRTRRRALAPPAPAKPKVAKPAANPIDDVVREIVAKCADGEWGTLAQIALLVRRADDAVLKAFKVLGKLGVAERKSEGKHQYWIAGKGDAALLSEIAKLKAELAEISAVLDQATAPAKAAAPAVMAH
jgi:hypothetical protein